MTRFSRLFGFAVCMLLLALLLTKVSPIAAADKPKEPPKSGAEYKSQSPKAYPCLFYNASYPGRVLIKLVGLRAEFNTGILDRGEWVVADGSTAIIEGERVVIVWDTKTGKRLDFQEVTIDKAKRFDVDSMGKITITDW